ncbi:HepT-like ribonuclease domain-containing protein [Alsobacter sp. KACC 23698]|uniref:HepT-like ribonuclease domain-containing protein n=1 Tax=Alsobacter sp. KACC 23698 TaxID=3149229 RepID=A0AAU7JFR9_9HYPH
MRGGDPGLYIELMAKAARDAIIFVEGLSDQDFLIDEKTQHAVSMCLIVIGENAKRLFAVAPDAMRGHDDIPWISMARMRDRIAHGYEDLHMGVIWKTVRDDLPPLVKALETMLLSYPDPESSTHDRA